MEGGKVSHVRGIIKEKERQKIILVAVVIPI